MRQRYEPMLISSKPVSGHTYEVHARCESGTVKITRHHSRGSAFYEAREQLLVKGREIEVWRC